MDFDRAERVVKGYCDDGDICPDVLLLHELDAAEPYDL